MIIDALGVDVPPPRDLALVRAGEAEQELRHIKEQIEIQWQVLLQSARTFSWTKGLVFVDSSGNARPVPITLLPTPVNRSCFDQARKLGPLFAQLALRSVLNLQWMQDALESCQSDELTKRLLGIAKRVYGPDVNQRDVKKDLHAGILRNDYMQCRDANGKLKLCQIELNTISAAFPGHATALYEFHRMAIETSTGRHVSAKKLPENDVVHKIGRLVADTVAAYCRKHKTSPAGTPSPTTAAGGGDSGSGKPPGSPGEGTESEDATTTTTLSTPLPVSSGHCVLFVVLAGENNIGDQCLVELAIRDAHRQQAPHEPPLPVYKYSFTELVKLMQTKDKDLLASLVLGACPRSRSRPLLIRDPIRRSTFREVACVYFRAGYVAEHYESDAAFDVRGLIEVSDAVSIPSVPLQLAGSKKLQTLWADEKVLEMLVPDSTARSAMRAVFEDAVDPAQPDATPNGRRLLQEAVEHPDRFVLKTLDEGGSPQFSQAVRDIAAAGMEQGVKQRAQSLGLPTSTFVLMRKIEPEAHVAVVHPGGGPPNSHWLSVDVTYSLSELGTYDGFLSDGPNALRVEHMGHLLRTKRATEIMGGVCVGAACLDSPWLSDD